MDFFASQDLARRNTRKLVILLILAVLAMCFAVYGLVLLILALTNSQNAVFRGEHAFHWTMLASPENLLLLGGVFVVILLIVSAGSAFKVAELRTGGSGVAEMLGGRRLVPGSADLAERRVLNVVEEMALASGVAVPPVYVLDNETGINAFAAGHTIDDAVIGVNRGTIEKLNRDELQGVIAHEFSHILNGDMRMSLRMIGLLHGIQALALLGLMLFRMAAHASRGSSRNKGGQAALGLIVFGLGLYAIGAIGLLFARIIKASVSRQREYLADASAVQFTRNPEGIAGALKVIGLDAHTSQVDAPNAETISHMFFANMMGELHANLFATHPPLIPRIQRIDPRFSGDFQEYGRTRSKATVVGPRESAPAKTPTDLRGKFGMMGREMGPLGKSFPIDPAILIAAIGAPSDDDVVYSQALIGNASPALLEAMRDPFSARCLVFASLLCPSLEVRRVQVEIINGLAGEASRRETLRVAKLLESLDSRMRLPLFEIVQGTLTALSAPQYLEFQKVVVRLIDADQQLSLFEFFLMHHLMVHLERHLGLRKRQKVRYESAVGLEREMELAVSVVCRFGHENANDAAAAFQAAAQSYPEGLGSSRYTGVNSSFTEFSAVLDKLNLAAPQVKKQLLEALLRAIIHDERITVEEAELYRAIAESLDCPVPPLAATAIGSFAQ